jgi:hypothetical protein
MSSTGITDTGSLSVSGTSSLGTTNISGATSIQGVNVSIDTSSSPGSGASLTVGNGNSGNAITASGWTGAGIAASSSSNYGVSGTSSSSYGVYGSSTNSWGGVFSSTNYGGVYGSGPSYGVYSAGPLVSTSTLSVSGASTLSSSLTVSGSTTLNGGLTATGGTILLNNSGGSTQIGWSGASYTYIGDIYTNSNLYIDATTSISGPLSVSYAGTFGGGYAAIGTATATSCNSTYSSIMLAGSRIWDACSGDIYIAPGGGYGSALYVDGYIDSAEYGYSYGWYTWSDRRLKNHIKDVDLGLDFVRSIRPVSYYLNKDDDKDPSERNRHLGVVAQELLAIKGVEKTAIVEKSKDGMYTVNYSELISPMIRAIRELYDKIVAAIDRISKMEQMIAAQQAEIDQLKAAQGQLNPRQPASAPHAPSQGGEKR